MENHRDRTDPAPDSAGVAARRSHFQIDRAISTSNTRIVPAHKMAIANTSAIASSGRVHGSLARALVRRASHQWRLHVRSPGNCASAHRGLRRVGPEAVDDVQFVIVETDDHERVVFQGATQDEVEAKVEDFLTWAS